MAAGCGSTKHLSNDQQARLKQELVTQGMRMTQGNAIEQADAIDRSVGIVERYEGMGLSKAEARVRLRDLAKQITSWCDSCATEPYTRADQVGGG